MRDIFVMDKCTKSGAIVGGIWGLISGIISFWLEFTAAFRHYGFATFRWYEIIVLFPGWVFDRLNYYIDVNNIFLPVFIPPWLYVFDMYVLLPTLLGAFIGIIISNGVKYVK